MPSEHILVVDDSVAISSLLANEILPLGGYRVTVAMSGEEALAIAEGSDDLDLVLCDLEMPGINGLDLLRELESMGVDIPAIMMTAFGSEAIAAQALRMGVKDYIIKPFTTDEILAAVERALTERRLRFQVEDLKASLEDHRQAMVVIQAISQAAGAGLDPADLLNRIILAAAYGGKARGGFIARLNQEANQLEVQAVANLPNWAGKQIPVESDPAVREALTTGQVSKSEGKAGSWFHVPLMRQQSPVGLMSVVSRMENPSPYMEHLFLGLAGYAAYVLENMQLRAELAVAMLQGKQPT